MFNNMDDIVEEIARNADVLKHEQKQEYKHLKDLILLEKDFKKILAANPEHSTLITDVYIKMLNKKIALNKEMVTHE